ncbi:MAG: hypothetical protein ACRC7R_01705 [Sarcina sp.]
MKLWEDDFDYKPSQYDKEKKVRAMQNRVDNRTAIMQELWKMHDKIVMGYKDLDMLLQVGNEEDIRAMKKGLKAVSEKLDKISSDLKMYYKNEYIDFE